MLYIFVKIINFDLEMEHVLNNYNNAECRYCQCILYLKNIIYPFSYIKKNPSDNLVNVIHNTFVIKSLI